MTFFLKSFPECKEIKSEVFKKSPEESGEDFRPPDASVETEEQCKCVKEISRKSTDVKKVVKNYPSI